MKKIMIMLAVLLVFSVLLSCQKDKGGDAVDSTTGAVTTVGVTTEKETENRISQSTLPPLTPDDPGDDEGASTTGGAVEAGDSSLIVPETDGSATGALKVTEDSGFGGDIHHAR